VNNLEITFIQGTGIKLVADDVVHSKYSLLFVTSCFTERTHSVFPRFLEYCSLHFL